MVQRIQDRVEALKQELAVAQRALAWMVGVEERTGVEGACEERESEWEYWEGEETEE